MINQAMIDAFHDELDSMEKAALLGAAKSVGQGLLKRMGSVVSGAKKPATTHVKKVMPQPKQTGGLELLDEMSPAARDAALKLKGPVGDMYRSSAGMATGGGAGTAVVDAGAAAMKPLGGKGTAVVDTLKSQAKSQAARRPVGTVTSEQAQRAPWKSLGELKGGTGLHPSTFPKGDFLGFGSGGKAVYAMAKMAEAYYGSPIVERIRAK